MKLQTPCDQVLAICFDRALQGWRLAFSALAVAAGAACMDGYPTQDAPAIDPLDMTQHQRLEQMNALGGDAHPDRKWSYVLLPGCVLRIDVHGTPGPRTAMGIPLRGATVKVATDRADDTFDVEVHPANPAARGEITVLEAQEWARAIGMSRTLRILEKGCADE
ncbi:MAG: hypothetical protein Q8N13_00370 [Acidovorax sp.]|nr:hypothetical protein [Acidovorax sp.]